MKFSMLKVKVVGLTPILGSISLDKEVATNFIVNKTKTDEERAQAIEDMKGLPEDDVLEK